MFHVLNIADEIFINNVTYATISSRTQKRTCNQLAIFFFSLNQMVLNVQVKDVGIKSYSVPKEMIWNDSHGLTAASLGKRIAEWSGIELKHLCIAKHFASKHEWLIIGETAQVSNKL